MWVHRGILLMYQYGGFFFIVHLNRWLEKKKKKFNDFWSKNFEGKKRHSNWQFAYVPKCFNKKLGVVRFSYATVTICNHTWIFFLLYTYKHAGPKGNKFKISDQYTVVGASSPIRGDQRYMREESLKVHWLLWVF